MGAAALAAPWKIAWPSSPGASTVHCALCAVPCCELCAVPCACWSCALWCCAVHGGLRTAAHCVLCPVLRAPCIWVPLRPVPCSLCCALCCCVLCCLPVLPVVHCVLCCVTPVHPHLLALPAHLAALGLLPGRGRQHLLPQRAAGSLCAHINRV